MGRPTSRYGADMSDLQCPVRALVTRPAEPTLPAPGGHWDSSELTDLGRRQAAALAETLAEQRVAAVYTSILTRAVQTGALIAETLRVGAAAVNGLQPFRPDAEREPDVVSRCHEAIGALADLHRGETIVVVSHGSVMSLALPWLAEGTANHIRYSRPPRCVPAELTVDGDGWRLLTWPGGPRADG